MFKERACAVGEVVFVDVDERRKQDRAADRYRIFDGDEITALRVASNKPRLIRKREGCTVLQETIRVSKTERGRAEK